jgi:regulator of replication initiation timing
LIHSVNAVTELLKANTELRDKMENVERDLESKEYENAELNIENQQLRERVELVEGILKGNSS